MPRRSSVMPAQNQVAPEPGTRKVLRNGHLQNINLADLGFDVCVTEEDQLQQLKRLRDMPCPISVKRMLRFELLRVQLMNQDVKMMTGFKGWKARQRQDSKRCSLFCKDLSYKTELWAGSFKEIEGHFGSGVLSYFVFLKWLFLLDLLIFGLLLIFIVIPQAIIPQATNSTYISPCTNSSLSRYQNLEYSGDIVATCSQDYQDYIVSTSGQVNGTYEVVSYMSDFFQGTGFMENTALFYGFYSSTDLNVEELVSTFVKSYNLPLAYIFVTGIYFIISLILMVRQSAQGYRETIIAGDNKYYQYCNKAFGSWDFALNDAKNVNLKKKSLNQEIINDLEEQRDMERRLALTTGQKCRLWTLRGLVNIFVLGALGGAGYLIYYTTRIGSEIVNTWEEYQTWNSAVQLLVGFMPSLTITLLNIILPVLFEKVVAGEDYKPQTEVQLTLIRTVFLRLASLGVLFATLYSEINCHTSPKDSCNVGTGSCQPLYCWETGVGQQIYKLIITDLIVQLGSILFVEFPRKLIVSKCSCKLAKLIGYQKFIIPKNVLDLIYQQTLCWLGAFFSPLIPAICVVKFFILFYTKKLSLLSNFVPNEKPYRASKSNSFFIIVLLISFLICCFPIVYVIAIMTPSRGCGPFRPYNVMYESITATVCDWPTGFQTFLSTVTSTAFSIPVIMVLCLVIYYQHIVTQAQKERAQLLKDQLLMEGKDKQFLVNKVNELQGKDKGSVLQDKQRQSQNTMGKHPNVSGSTSKLSAADVLYEEGQRSNDPGFVDPGV